MNFSDNKTKPEKTDENYPNTVENENYLL